MQYGLAKQKQLNARRTTVTKLERAGLTERGTTDFYGKKEEIIVEGWRGSMEMAL